jgi:hypothetical protein
MKAVPDSMLWVSYSVSEKGYRHAVIQRAVKARVRLATSAYILNEVARTVVQDFGKTERFALLACKAILRLARLVRIPPMPGRFVPGDPDDDPIIETALSAKADCIVTADKVLLSVGKARGVEIITLDQFVERLPVEAP